MPQESNSSSTFSSPSKNLRGLKSLIYNNNDASYAEEIINDRELAQRKAEEAAARRYQAAEWLRLMDHGALQVLPQEPTDEEFCLALRNGLILCNVLNKVNPGAIHKVVENPVLDVQSMEPAAQSAIQYFENMRNFLMAVGQMKLLTFEASDLEKGGSSNKVVDCILCLKGYYEWKQAGGFGVWRYGGTVRITSFPKDLPSCESTDESFDDSEASLSEQLLEYLHLSTEVSIDESSAANAMAFLFDRFALGLLQACLMEKDGFANLPLNSMVIDTVLRKAVQDFSALIVSQSNQLGHFLKKMLNNSSIPQSKPEFLESITKYINERNIMVSSDFSRFCICGGRPRDNRQSNDFSGCSAEALHLQQKQLQELRNCFRQTKLEIKQIQSGWEDEIKSLVNHIRSLETAASSYHKVLEENRMLYNQVQDLKGTIRVYCRVRPFLGGQHGAQSTVDYIGENGNIMIVNPYKHGKDARRVFTFNKVFGTNVTQQQIYVDTQPLIRSVLDGYNVCIFAYGQTGSGKTYTMSGPDLTSEDTWGVNYRALGDLFEISKERMHIIKYDIEVQMVEIYNEQVRDLLVMDGSNRKLDIRNNSQVNGLNIPDASLIPVHCTQDVLELMKIGQKNRAVGATALNERSSRSHSILTIHVRGSELVSGSSLKGCLHLVDLAGSERVDKSEAVGERLKEAQHINRSLSALGDVISALAQKSPHIPYRNSKLTQVLQDSLGGHAKTLMFVHINPEANAIGETISTLKFAERVASIDLGAARSNKETGEIREFKEEISSLKLVLEKKETELEQLKSTHVRGAVSPLRIQRYNSNASIKAETSQKLADDTRTSEVRSCSSGKQRRSRFPSKFTDKETILPFLAEDKSQAFDKPRSPSPPVRRSISTDRGALFRSRLKPETLDNPAVMKLPFPASISGSNKFIPTIPAIIPENSGQGCQAQEPRSITESLYSLQSRVTSRKVQLDHEEEQLKQTLNIRQGGIRKTKAEARVKAKHQQSTKVQKPDDAVTYISMNAGETLNAARKDNLLEAENDHYPVGSPFPVPDAIRLKKLQRNLSRNSQNVEPRELMQTAESLSTLKHANKPANGMLRDERETSNSSMPEFRRSRSTPRGKFLILP